MTTEQQRREKLRKIAALLEGATTTAGERSAALAAIERIKQVLQALRQTEPPTEYQFTLPDHWQRRFFMALCRLYSMDSRHTAIAGSATLP